MRLANKIAIITGSTNGIGLATVHKFAAEGAMGISVTSTAWRSMPPWRAIPAAGRMGTTVAPHPAAIAQVGRAPRPGHHRAGRAGAPAVIARATSDVYT